MQEALQNPHYKKIWEKVIMNRHPKAKSLEEALKKESNERYCQYILTDNDNYIVDGDYISKYYHHNNNYKILGSPITLEDIMLYFLQNKVVFNIIRHSDERIVIRDYIEFDCNGDRFCFILTKPLHEQTPETWEKIANLI